MLDIFKTGSFLFLFSLCFAFQANAVLRCDEALTPKAEMKATSFVFDLYQSRPITVAGVFKGQSLPTWTDYSWIMQVSTAAKQGKLSAVQALTIRREIQALYKVFDAKTADQKLIFVDKAYRFFEHLESISQIDSYRAFKWNYLNWAPKDSELIEQGKKTVASLVTRIRDQYQLSGFKNPTELVDRVYNYDAAGKRALELVDDQLIVTIRRPEGGRFWIPITGFQNQRVTGSSQGTFDPSFRDRIESTLIYQNLADYKEQSVRYKPNYGEARPRFELASPNFQTYADHYGGDRWVIKKQVLEERGTWTPTDSFGQPQASNGKQTEWNQLFIPWVHREFLAPYLMQNLRNNDGFYPGVVPPNVGSMTSSGSLYFEVQIWGPVTLKDVEAFAFSGTPPGAAFLKLLQENGIKVWDLRKTQGKLYDGTSP